jgi:HEPN domain-containing protein
MKLLISALNRKKESTILEKQLLEAARIDLRACRLLYDQGIFSQSVYHLQQAVEKSSKSLVLSLGVIDEGDLKRIGHKTPRAFLKLLDESEIGEAAKLITEKVAPNALTDTSDYRNFTEVHG